MPLTEYPRAKVEEPNYIRRGACPSGKQIIPHLSRCQPPLGWAAPPLTFGEYGILDLAAIRAN